MKLSIAVVTMNRAEQLKEALASCLKCVLPKETEFVIIDNASTDNTEEIVKEVISNSGYPFYYEKLSENIGCGRGRNYAYSKTNGQYYYSLDDDAIIDENNPDFFIKALEILDTHKEIVTLTTQIYDTAWKTNRVNNSSIKLDEDLYECLMFYGTSHFLRKSLIKDDPYFANSYGYEEIPLSLYVVDSDCKNVFYSAVKIIHMPKVDKWDKSDEKNHQLIINECVLQYVLKKYIFPTVFTPIVYAAYIMRCKKHLKNIPNWKAHTRDIFETTERKAKLLPRISVKTVIKLYKKFGIAVF